MPRLRRIDVMKVDIFGIEITEGATIAFNQPGYKNLITGKILKVGNKKAHIEYELDEHPRTTSEWHKDMVVKPT